MRFAAALLVIAAVAAGSARAGEETALARRGILVGGPSEADMRAMTRTVPRMSGPRVYDLEEARRSISRPRATSSDELAFLPDATAPKSLRSPFVRQDVAYDGPEKPGTIIIDTPRKFLLLVTAPGRAIRYGIGVGRPGFTWAGVKSITRKAEWPGWTPPPEMLKRRPDLPLHMAGGPQNPLGARALYLGSSLYRIHGTNEPDTIGRNVSSGCIRMMNEDVIDLYDRVKVGTRVIVM